MKKPTLHEIEKRLKEEFRGLELKYEHDKFFERDILVHKNKDYKIEISVRDVNMSDERMQELWPNGYIISLSYSNQNKPAGGGYGSESIDDFIEKVNRYTQELFELNDFEQMQLF